jgi:hypothetical protein
MTYEELIVFYFKRGCVIVPGSIVTEVFYNKEGSFDDQIAVIVKTDTLCDVAFYEGNNEVYRGSVDKLTPGIVEIYLNRVILKEKYKVVDKKLEEIKKDFE